MATVIKAGHTGRLLTRPRTIDLSDHLREAGGIVDVARQQAAEIVATAQRQAIEIRETAKKAGYSEGQQLGLEAGERTGYETARSEATARFAAEQASLVSMLQAAVSQLDESKEDRAIEAERHLLDFAVDVASRMTFAVGRCYREAALANCRRAIDLVGTKSDVTIQVHPDDLASMRSFAESTLKRLDGSSSVRVVAQPSMAPGGCRVETDRTLVDASLETQVDEMVSLLLGTGQIQDDGRPPGLSSAEDEGRQTND